MKPRFDTDIIELNRNIDAENNILGMFLIDNNLLNDAINILSENNFYDSRNGMIYKLMSELYAKNKKFDIVLLYTEICKKGLQNKLNSATYLCDLQEVVTSTALFNYYLQLILELSKRRNLITSCVSLINDAKTNITDEELFINTEKIITEVLTDNSIEIKNKNEILNEISTYIENSNDKNNRMLGLQTGFYELDKITNGLLPGNFIIIGGRPSMGKTSFAVRIAEHITINENKSVLFFNFETTAYQLLFNIVCSISRINTHNVRNGNIRMQEKMKLISTQERLRDIKLFVEDSYSLNLLGLISLARKHKEKNNIDLIIIDYLQLINTDIKTRIENRQQEISMISRSIKLLANELQIPIIALCQLNRNVENREDHKPRLSDLRESGSLEQDADIILFLYRKDYYSPENKTNTAELNIAKHRNGGTGTITLCFLPEFARFENLDFHTNDELLREQELLVNE